MGNLFIFIWMSSAFPAWMATDGWTATAPGPLWDLSQTCWQHHWMQDGMGMGCRFLPHQFFQPAMKPKVKGCGRGQPSPSSSPKPIGDPQAGERGSACCPAWHHTHIILICAHTYFPVSTINVSLEGVGEANPLRSQRDALLPPCSCKAIAVFLAAHFQGWHVYKECYSH